jgi:hypothetical protein
LSCSACRQLPAHPNVVTFFGLSSCDVRGLLPSLAHAGYHHHQRSTRGTNSPSLCDVGEERAVPGHRVRCRWLARSLPD